jgi:ATP-binding cassette subfamily F protein uup
MVSREEPTTGDRTLTTEKQASTNGAPKKLSFKEKFELESLEKEMPLLQEEKKKLEEKMSGNIPYDELQKASDRISVIMQQLDEKEMRWLELSERQS